MDRDEIIEEKLKHIDKLAVKLQKQIDSDRRFDANMFYVYMFGCVGSLIWGHALLAIATLALAVLVGNPLTRKGSK